MEQRRKSLGGLILGGAMLVLAGFLIGGYGGSQLTATFLVNQGLNRDARDMQSQVMTLQHLREGEVLQAIELLESRLDNNLISFDPREPFEGLSEQTQVSLEGAINQAKAYRQLHPRKSGRAYEDEMVENLFEKTR